MPTSERVPSLGLRLRLVAWLQGYLKIRTALVTIHEGNDGVEIDAVGFKTVAWPSSHSCDNPLLLWLDRSRGPVPTKVVGYPTPVRNSIAAPKARNSVSRYNI